MKTLSIISGALCAFVTFCLMSTAHAVITVNTTDDIFDDESELCSLRMAIEAVNDDDDFGGCPDPNGDNTIQLDAATYTLTRGNDFSDDNNRCGDLDIRVSMTINGMGADQTTVDASGLATGECEEIKDFGEGNGSRPDRAIHIVPRGIICESGFCPVGLEDPLDSLGNGPPEVLLMGMTVTGGDARSSNAMGNGGGIHNGGILTIDGVTVTDNDACNGGGIFNGAFEDDLDLTGGMEEPCDINNRTGLGFSFGLLTVQNDSQVNGNRAQLFGGGIASSSTFVNEAEEDTLETSGRPQDVLVEILFSEVNGNIAVRSGGGIALDNSFLVLDHSTVDSNTTFQDGGGIRGLFNIFRLSEESEATGMDGEEIRLETYITHSAITRNVAEPPPADFDPQPVPEAQGDPNQGGGIFYVGGNHALVNTTVSSNTAISRGGGIYFDPIQFWLDATSEETGAQGVVSDQPVPGMNLFNVTVADNQALGGDFNGPKGEVSGAGSPGEGGGIFLNFFRRCEESDDAQLIDCERFPELKIFNTLIARNLAAIGNDCATALLSGDYNMITDSSDCEIICHNLQDNEANGQGPVEPMECEHDKTDAETEPLNLGPLDDNGGPTETHALLIDGATGPSQAIDMGRPPAEGDCRAILDPVPTIIGPEPKAVGEQPMVVTEPLTDDQRDFFRPFAILDPALPICDIGAFEAQAFEFDVTKTSTLTGPAELGQMFEYIITITNTGPSTIPTLHVEDQLPLGCNVFGVEFVDVQVAPPPNTCSNVAGTITCDVGPLDPGEQIVITIQVTACGPVADGEVHPVDNTVVVDFTEGEITASAQTGVTIIGNELEGSGCACSKEPNLRFSTAHHGIPLMAFFLMVGVLLRTRRKARQRK